MDALVRWLWEKLNGRRPLPSQGEARAAGEPVLMLDTSGHMVLINDIAFTPDGRQLVSASGDKTIRVWDLAMGKTARTIRGESAPGRAGMIYAMALSPDGKWLATGGWFARGHGIKDEEVGTIRLYDFASGRLIALLEGHENVVLGLAFSPDGRHLISGSFDTTAIIWDVGPLSGASAEQRQPKHRLTGHTDHIMAVGFTPDGARAVTGSFDHDLRLWRVADGGEIARMPGHGDTVQSLAVAPDGTIASGDGSGEIRLWDGRTGAFRRTLASQGTSVSSLSFSPDGKTLMSGFGQGSGFDCHVYDLASGQEIVSYSGHGNIVVATAISPDGRWAATGGSSNHEIHVWDLRTGEPRLGQDGQSLTLGGGGQPVWAAGFAADGRSIAWGNIWESHTTLARNPLQHMLELPSAVDTLPHPHDLDPTEQGSFRRAVASQGGWSLQHRKKGGVGDDAILDITRDGETVASIERGSTSGYQHRTYSFTPDGETVISGGDGGALTAYDRAGKKLGDFIGHEGDVWTVAPSPDGRYLLSGSDDQTVRLWNLKTPELLVTLFHGQDGEWVMWTPQGYYVASENGDSLIGWQINYGPSLTPDYVEARQLARRLFRPDVIARTIALASAKAAIAELGVPANIIARLLTARPPQFRIVHPKPGTRINVDPISVLLEFAPNPDPLEDLRITVNGRQIATPRGHRKARTVPLQQGQNDIRIVAVNRAGETPGEISVTYNGRGELDRRGALYMVAVGVDHYEHYPEAHLRFAAKDARDFLAAMADYSGPLHKRVESRLLVRGAGSDSEPTAENIAKALRLFRRAEPNDTVVLFLAGHGTSELTDSGFRLRNVLDRKRRTGDFLFLPQNAKVDGEGWLPKTVLKWPDLQLPLHNAKGLRLLFVDTCHAHGAYDPRLVQEAGSEQIVVFAATDRGLPAYEDSEFENGTFTLALTQGLEGGAAADQEGNIGLGSLQQFVHEQVRGLSNGRQTPMFRNTGGPNFIIAKRPGAAFYAEKLIGQGRA
jgi:WD40 repeat protein